MGLLTGLTPDVSNLHTNVENCLSISITQTITAKQASTEVQPDTESE